MLAGLGMYAVGPPARSPDTGALWLLPPILGVMAFVALDRAATRSEQGR